MSEEETLRNYGWMAIRCNCGAAVKCPMGHAFAVNNTHSPKAIYTIDCPICGKTLNLKVEIWEP